MSAGATLIGPKQGWDFWDVDFSRWWRRRTKLPGEQTGVAESKGTKVSPGGSSSIGINGRRDHPGHPLLQTDKKRVCNLCGGNKRLGRFIPPK